MAKHTKSVRKKKKGHRINVWKRLAIAHQIGPRTDEIFVMLFQEYEPNALG